MRTLVSILAGAAAVIAGAAALIAATTADDPRVTYTSVANGNWANPNTWDQKSGYPGAGDTVIIDGETVTITGRQAARSVTVSSGQLRIDGQGCGTDCAELKFGAAEINPSLSITPPTGVVLVDSALIVMEQSMTLAGGTLTSSLRGLGSCNAIVLAPGESSTVTLTTLLLVHGSLAIKKEGDGEGVFVNLNAVRADIGGGVLSLDSSLDDIIDGSTDCGGAPWQVTVDDAVLRFDLKVSLNGDIDVGPGRLDINETVNAEHLRIFDGGSITPNLLSGWLFFRDHCSSSECQWITSPVILPVRCHN